MSTATAVDRPSPLLGIVVALAEALGPGWIVDPEEGSCEVFLAGPRGERIRVSRDSSRSGPTGHRLTFYGLLPPELNPYNYRDDGNRSIGADGRKPASALARDIRSRLLPAYHAAVATARLRWVANAADHRVRDALAACIAAALGEDARKIEPLTRRDVVVRRGAYGQTVDARFEVPAGDGTVALTIKVSQDLAVQLAEAVGRLPLAPHARRA